MSAPRDDAPGRPVPERLDAGTLRRWAVLARSAMAAHRDSIDGLNVFPVPDADTGTNMFRTLDAAVEATLDVGRREGGVLPHPADDLERFARAALIGARGNSGVIVSQLVRGLVEALRDHPDGADAPATAAAFERAARAAYAAVRDPAEGTILTVAQAAARGAGEAATHGADLLGVVEAACAAARQALDATTGQLGALSAAGVVDAGGAGLVVVLDALRRVLTGAGEDVVPVARPVVAPCAGAQVPAAGYTGPRHEVMFVVQDADDAVAGQVRAALDGLGDSVLLVGGRGGPWRGHVHTDDPDAALAAVAPLGEPTDVTVQDLRAQPHGGALVALADGPGVVAALQAAGLRVLPRTAAALAGLPDDAVLLTGERRLAGTWRGRALDAPSDAHLLVAAAVHDPGSADPVADVEAALADVEAVVVADAHDAALPADLPDGPLAAVTVVTGAGVDADHPAVRELLAGLPHDVEHAVVEGGDPAYALTIGVER